MIFIATIWTYESVKDYIENNLGMELLSTEYKNMRTKLSVKCKEGHITYRTFDSIRHSNGGCRICTLKHNENKKNKYK